MSSLWQDTRPLRAWWKRRSRRFRRITWLLLLIPVLLTLTPGIATSDDGNSTTPSALGWISVHDSHGVSIWAYDLSLDRGGIRNPGKWAWSFMADLVWGIYRLVVAVSLWIVDWTLSFDWLRWISGPVAELSENLHMIVQRFGLVPTLLTITALTAVLWMMKGRWVLGIFELGMSLIIASLAVGLLADPVELVAGEDGVMMGSRDAGLAIAYGLKNDGDTSMDRPEVVKDPLGISDITETEDLDSFKMRREIVGMMADTFVRQPQQVVNYGEVLDGTKCEDDYQEVIEDGPYGDDDDVRDAVSDCNEEAGQVAENPGSGMVMSLVMLSPAGSVALLFAALLCGVVLVTGFNALYQAVKGIPVLVFSLLPGGARGPLWMTFAEVIIAFVTVIFSIVFLASYMLMLQGVFDAGGQPMAKFFIFDVLLLVGVLVFWKGRQRLKASTDRLAQAMSKRPGGAGPSRLPQKQRFDATGTYHKGKLAVTGAKMAGTAALGAGGVGWAAGKLAGSAVKKPVDTAMGRIGFAHQNLSRFQRPTPHSQSSSSAERVLERVNHKNQPKGRLLPPNHPSGAPGFPHTPRPLTGPRGGSRHRLALNTRLHPTPRPGGATPRTTGPGADQELRVVRGEVVRDTRQAAGDRLRSRLDARAIPLGSGPRRK